eukprot:550871_1
MSQSQQPEERDGQGNLIPQQPQPHLQTYKEYAAEKVGHIMGYGTTGFQKFKDNPLISGGICFVLLALIALIVVLAVYKGEGHSHAVPMDAPAGAKVCRDVTTLMADNGFTNYTLKQNFVEFGGEMVLACPHRETEGDITITCSEEGEIALVNNQCLATDECSPHVEIIVHAKFPEKQLDLPKATTSYSARVGHIAEFTCNNGDVQLTATCTLEKDNDADFSHWVVNGNLDQCDEATPEQKKNLSDAWTTLLDALRPDSGASSTHMSFALSMALALGVSYLII